MYERSASCPVLTRLPTAPEQTPNYAQAWLAETARPVHQTTIGVLPARLLGGAPRAASMQPAEYGENLLAIGTAQEARQLDTQVVHRE